MVLIPCYCPCPHLDLIPALVLCCVVFISRSQNKDACPGKVLPYLHMAPAPATFWALFSLFSSQLPFAPANVPPLLSCEPSTACASAGKNPDEISSFLKSQLKSSCAAHTAKISATAFKAHSHLLLFSTVGRMSCAKGMSQEQTGKRTIVHA